MNKAALTGILLAVTLVIGGLWWLRQAAPPAAPAVATVPAAPEAAAAEDSPEVVPEAVYDAPSTPGPESAAPALPPLDDSDATTRAAVLAVFGTSFGDWLISERLIRRFVITVLSLDGEPVPLRQRPLKHVPGLPSVVRGEGEQLSLSADNARRYQTYVSLLEAADMNAVATLYQRHYPLIQQAYAELGESKREFNDRFIRVIDHLLAAPDPATPVDLVRPKVLYEFADPQLEALSSGQKILVRMGPAHAATVKARLRALRTAIVARSARSS